MNAQDLYEKLKEAARFFGVGFHGFALIDARIVGDQLVLTCNGEEIRFSLK